MLALQTGIPAEQPEQGQGVTVTSTVTQAPAVRAAWGESESDSVKSLAAGPGDRPSATLVPPTEKFFFKLKLKLKFRVTGTRASHSGWLVDCKCRSNSSSS